MELGKSQNHVPTQKVSVAPGCPLARAMGWGLKPLVPSSCLHWAPLPPGANFGTLGASPGLQPGPQVLPEIRPYRPALPGWDRFWAGRSPGSVRETPHLPPGVTSQAPLSGGGPEGPAWGQPHGPQLHILHRPRQPLSSRVALGPGSCWPGPRGPGAKAGLWPGHHLQPPQGTLSGHPWEQSWATVEAVLLQWLEGGPYLGVTRAVAVGPLHLLPRVRPSPRAVSPC